MTRAERQARSAAWAAYRAGTGPKPPSREPYPTEVRGRAAKDAAREEQASRAERYARLAEMLESSRDEVDAPGLDGPPEPVAFRELPPLDYDDLEDTTPHVQPMASASRVVTIVSDLHFEESTDWPAWRAYRAFHRDTRPSRTVILGDFVDFAAISRYPSGADTPAYVIPEIQCFVREANALRADCDAVTVVEGNHDGDRWSKAVGGDKAVALRGALGLDLKSQCQRHGLDPSIEWFRESAGAPHLQVGQFYLTHGHRGAGPYGPGKNVAARMLANGYGEDQIQGHTHLSQLQAITTPSGRTVVAIANGCFQRRQDYSPRAAWTHSFTVIELHAPDYTRATAYPVVIERGRFSLWGRTYDGNAG